jgi:hypothetical protein
VDLDYTDISDEDSVKVIELFIEFFDECHEWYLNLYVSAYFINHKQYFKSYRSSDNYVISTVISDLFSIEKIGII